MAEDFNTLLRAIDVDIADLDSFSLILNNNIDSAITAIFDVVLAEATTAFDAVTQPLTIALAKANDALARVENKINSNIDISLADIDRIANATNRKISDNISGEVTNLSGVVASNHQAIQLELDASLANLSSAMVTLDDKIGRKLDLNQAVIIEDINLLETVITTSLDAALLDIESDITGPLTKAAIATPEILQQIQETLAGGLPPAPDLSSFVATGLGKAFVWLFMGGDEPDEDDASKDFTNVVDLLKNDPVLGELTKALTGAGFVGDVLSQALGWLLFLPAFLLQGIGSTFAGVFEQARIASIDTTRPTTLDPAILTNIQHRFPDAIEFVKAELGKLGLNDERIGVFLSQTFHLLGVGENLTLWRRRLIDDATLDTRLGALGFQEPDREDFKRLAFAVPPIRDVILFAVREVFDPELAEQLQLFEGVTSEQKTAFDEKIARFGTGQAANTEAFAEFARQSGVSPEWSTAYWAAHWTLPGVSQMFEMFQRGQLTSDDLDRAIRAKDFSPFWRDKLKAIAYNPLTRVDVRRMNALGLIADDELKRRYQDVGFSPDNADMMAQFTVAYNNRSDTDAAKKIRELTRAQVLKFLDHGEMTTGEAIARLERLGYEYETASAIVGLRLLENIDNEKDARIRVIRAEFNNASITFNEAVEKLDSLDVSPVQRRLVMAQLEAEQASRVQHPSKTDVEEFFQAQIISQATYLDALRTLGYSEVWVLRYLRLARKNMNGGDTSFNRFPLDDPGRGALAQDLALEIDREVENATNEGLENDDQLGET